MPTSRIIKHRYTFILNRPYKIKQTKFKIDPIATGKIKKLPIADIPICTYGSSVIGFGYDHVNDDLKVMRTAATAFAGIMVSVYSLKNNSWTRAESLSTQSGGFFGVFANGSLYWRGRDNNIVAFDLSVHSQRELPLPDGVDKIREYDRYLIALSGYLCLIAESRNFRTDIWLMNKEENCWYKLLSPEGLQVLLKPGSIKE